MFVRAKYAPEKVALVMVEFVKVAPWSQVELKFAEVRFALDRFAAVAMKESASVPPSSPRSEAPVKLAPVKLAPVKLAPPMVTNAPSAVWKSTTPVMFEEDKSEPMRVAPDKSFPDRLAPDKLHPLQLTPGLGMGVTSKVMGSTVGQITGTACAALCPVTPVRAISPKQTTKTRNDGLRDVIPKFIDFPHI
jgi:hypothetical protein